MNNPADTLNVEELKGVFDSMLYILIFIGLLLVVYIFMRVQQRRRLDRMHNKQRRRRLLR
jgi:flagellar biogenesis protein FliO